MTPATPNSPAGQPTWPRYVALAIIALGVLVHLPSLGWGFMWDDFYHQLVLNDELPGLRATAWNLYDFDLRAQAGAVLYDVGLPPWWIDRDFYVRFLRPVTSASLVLDHALYGRWAPGYHMTSLALFAVVLGLAWRLLLGLGLTPRAALIGLLLLAIEDSWTLPVGWPANRNALLATLFCLATVLCALRYARRPTLWWLLATFAGQILAFGSKESGLVAGPLAALTLWLQAEPLRSRPWGRALIALAGQSALWRLAAVGFAMLAVYVSLGYGANSLAYTAPWHSPATTLTRLSAVIPAAFYSLFIGLGTDLLMARPEALTFIQLTAPLLIPLGAWVIVSATGGSRLLAFAAAWVLLSCVVEVGGELNDRLWVNAAVGSSIIAGVFLDHLLRTRPAFAPRTAAAWLTACVIAQAGLIAAPGINLFRGSVLVLLGRSDTEANLTAPIPSAPRPLDVIAFNARTSLQALGLLPMWRFEHPGDDVRFFAVQYGRRAVQVCRVDAQTLEVSSAESPFANGMIERLFRTTDAPRPVGSQITTVSPRVTVTELGDGGYRTIRLEFAEPLESPRYCWIAFENGAYRRITLPLIGERILLPNVPEPMRGIP